MKIQTQFHRNGFDEQLVQLAISGFKFSCRGQHRNGKLVHSTSDIMLVTGCNCVNEY